MCYSATPKHDTLSKVPRGRVSVKEKWEMTPKTIEFTEGSFKTPDIDVKRFAIEYSLDTGFTGKIVFRISDFYLRIWGRKVPWEVDERTLEKVFWQYAYDKIKEVVALGEAPIPCVEIELTTDSPLLDKYERLKPTGIQVAYGKSLSLE